MVHENFIKTIEHETPEFVALMKILSPMQEFAEKGRKILCLVNHILDFYILGDKLVDDVKMPIIYFPLCEEWAQSLCEDFLTLKMSILFGDKVRLHNELYCRLHPDMYLPSGVTKKQIPFYSEQYRLKHRIAKLLTPEVQSYHAKENEKCLIYSRYISDQHERSREMKRHYHFVHDFVGTEMADNKYLAKKYKALGMDKDISSYFKSIFSSEKSIALIGENEDVLYRLIEENDGKTKIPHIFLFLQKDMDGRNAQICLRLQRSTINEYNEDYDTGIKNVFFFAFSQKPYRLQRIFENKHSLVERIQREKVAQTRDFISFTDEEMDYVFNRKQSDVHYVNVQYDTNSEEYQIKLAFDLILQDLPHEMKLRNELAVCFTKRQQDLIKEDILEQNPEANEEYIDYFLQVLSNKTRNELVPQLIDWINFNQLAVVLDYNVNSKYKIQLKEFLENECGAINITFYTFKNFKAHKDNQIFVNSIKENRILILSMLNHCTGRNWAIYPNSFDQYHLNGSQSVLQVNNLLVFDPRFSWYQYRYVEQQKLLLNSDYRTKYVKSCIALPQKPTNVGIEPKDDEDEQNGRTRQSGRDQIRYTISFTQRQHRTLDEDELVLCKNKGSNELEIYTISDLYNMFDDQQLWEVQPLVDFHQPLEVFVDTEERKMGDGEVVIRNNPKYNLTESEKESKREMWKILLDHKVNLFGEQKVYNDIMQPLLPMERIQLNSFRRWLDQTETAILPRSRRMQRRVIEEYLEIESIYTRMLRLRKSRISTNTEGKNTIFRVFLTHCLPESNVQKAYESLSNEVKDYLNIARSEDVKTIIDLIKDEILNLRPVKSIEI